MIPYGKQAIDENDIAAVVDVLKSDFITQGPVLAQFEQAIADYTQSQYAVAASNATACLHLACLALEVEPGDIVWTSPISFVASSNCALYCGAEIDFVDIDPNTGLMSVDALATKLTQAKQAHRLPKVIIPVHLCGQSCDMEKIHQLVSQYDIKIIEDASHAIGGQYQHKPIGNCQFSDITVFSFHPVKIITTGEGGVATTNDAKLAHKLTLLRSHGVTRNSDELQHHEYGSWYYEQQQLGFNYRLTDIQAALGLSQLNKLDDFIERRNQLAANYHQMIKPLAIDTLQVNENCLSSYHLYVIKLHNSQIHKTVFEALRAKKIGVNLHYFPIHLQPYYQNLGFTTGMFEHAEAYCQHAISLPLYPELSKQDQQYVIETLAALLQQED